MIIETLIASIAVVTIAGTWLGLRFARDTMAPGTVTSREQRKAIAMIEDAVKRDLYSDDDRKAVRALLVARPEVLPPAVRTRALQWLNRQQIVVNVE